MDAALARLISIVVVALAPLTGCTPEEEDPAVSIFGDVTVGPDLGDPPELVTGGHLDAYDDEGTILSRGEEPWPGDRPGYYRVQELPPESHVHLVAWDDEGELVPTILAARTPTDNLFARDGELFALRVDWLDRRLVLLSKDGLGPRVEDVLDPLEDGWPGFVLGRLAEAEAGEGSRVTLRVDGEPLETLYLDEVGIAREALASTGPGGEFAVFDVPPGPVSVEVSLADGTDLEPFTVLVQEQSCTSLYGLEVGS